jgi:hypothetical protein
MNRPLAALCAALMCSTAPAAYAQDAPPSIASTGNQAAWDAGRNCGPRTTALTPIAGMSAPGLTQSPGAITLAKSASLSGVDLRGVDTNILGDGTVVNITDAKVQKTGSAHLFVTGMDEGGNYGGNPTLNLDYADIDYTGAQNLSQGNITNNYTAGAKTAKLHIAHSCLHDAPSDYFSTFLGGEFFLDNSFVAAMCRKALLVNGDHCEAGHINGGVFKARNTMFDMEAGGGVPCCITGVLFFDAISTGYDIDATLDHVVIKGMQSQGFLYPIVLSPGKANVTLHVSNSAIQKGIHGQYIAGIGPYGAFNARVLDEGGNRDLDSNEPVILGEVVAPTPVDPRDAQIAALTTQLAQAAETATQLSAGLVSVTATSGRYASALGTVIVLGTADNAKRQGPTKADMAAVILTAKTALANH